MIDPEGKTRHCALMVVAAGQLASLAPEDLQRRVLARYCFLYGDALLLWAQRWRNQLKRLSESSARARSALPIVRRLGDSVAAGDGVRDYLSAKRRAAAGLRADDIEATTRLWAAVNDVTVPVLVEAALDVYEVLSGSPRNPHPLVMPLALAAGDAVAIAGACPRADHGHWRIATDTAADLRPYTIPAAQGGNLGRRIAQINDVAIHLDLLLAIAPHVTGRLAYDCLVRSMIILELNALLDLALGPAPGARHASIYALVDLCRQGRASDAADELEALRASIDPEGWSYVRWARNKLSAHLDDELPTFELHRHIMLADFRGLVRLAEHVLDRLDWIGSTELDLKLLLFGERPIRSWPIDPARPAPGAPSPRPMRGALADLFRRIDSPFITAAAVQTAAPALAGMCAGRRPRPRTPIPLPPSLDRYLDEPQHVRAARQQAMRPRT